MALSVDAYKRLIYGLLPQGRITRRQEGTVLDKIVQSIAEEFTRIGERAARLLEEYDPLTTLELLGDYERMLDIPDDCQERADSVSERQRDVKRKLTNRGGASLAFFEELALGVGYVVEARNTFPFRAGKGTAGSRLYGILWLHWFQIAAEDFNTVKFRAGVGRCGERLVTTRNDILECVIRRAKPAHTQVQFLYGG